MKCSTEKVLQGNNPHLMLHYFGPRIRDGWFKFHRQCLRCKIIETEKGLDMAGLTPVEWKALETPTM